MRLGGLTTAPGDCGCCTPPCHWTLCVTAHCCTPGYLVTNIPNVGAFSVRFQGPNGEDVTIPSQQNVTGVQAIAIVSIPGGNLAAIPNTGNGPYSVASPPGYTWSGGVRAGNNPPDGYPTVTFGINGLGQIWSISLSGSYRTGWTVKPTLTIDPPPTILRETYTACYADPSPGDWTLTWIKTGWHVQSGLTNPITVEECKSQTLTLDVRLNSANLTVMAQGSTCCYTTETLVLVTDPDGKVYGPAAAEILPAFLPQPGGNVDVLGHTFTCTCPTNVDGHWSVTTQNPSDAGCVNEPFTVPYSWCFCNDKFISAATPVKDDYRCTCTVPDGVYPTPLDWVSRTVPANLDYSDDQGSCTIGYGVDSWGGNEYVPSAHVFLGLHTVDPYHACYFIGDGTYVGIISVRCISVDNDGTITWKVQKTVSVLIGVQDPIDPGWCGATTGSNSYIFDESTTQLGWGSSAALLVLTGYATDHVMDHPTINLSGSFTEWTWGGRWNDGRSHPLPPDVGGGFTITGG